MARGKERGGLTMVRRAMPCGKGREQIFTADRPIGKGNASSQIRAGRSPWNTQKNRKPKSEPFSP